ncbi:MAG TPA: TrmH family RNA methyltransferase [Candidatus Saccharimonadales bacterium]|nr:TrmH family RNA methyltransferase [Candidatus Saccharimonadales bacterium]
MRSIVLIAHNLRSCYNVGSLLRTAEGLGVSKVYLTGYTPYPLEAADTRLPHLAQKIDKQIHKTALGAEKQIEWHYTDDILMLFTKLKDNDFTIAALEQTADSLALPQYKVPEKIAIVLGREVEGIETEVLSACDVALEIPMFGSKESFNVAQAAAMALYHCRFIGM